jgi:hypothetical protein
VAQVHEHRSAATVVGLAALFDIEEATSRLRARTVVYKIKARPAPTAHLPGSKLSCHQNTVRRTWIYSILRLADCCHQCGLVVSPLAPDAIARALEGVVSILTAPATVVCTVSHAPYPQHAQEGAPVPGASTAVHASIPVVVLDPFTVDYLVVS